MTAAPAPAVCWSCRSEITDGRCECSEDVHGLALTALLIVAEIAAFVALGMLLVWGWRP